QLGRIGVYGIVDGRHHAALHQHLDHVDGATRHAVGEFGDGNGLGNHDFARAGRRSRLLLAVRAVELTAERGQRAHALVIFGQRPRDGELAGAAPSRGRFARRGSFGRRLAAFLGGHLLFFFGEVAGALDGRGGGGGGSGSAGLSLLF